jgi:putative DNA primase/helicase
MTNWSRLVARYPSLGSSAKGMVKCPCHNDSVQSLSVKRTPDGDALLYCFAGCRFEDVRDALGLERMARSSNTSPLPSARERQPLPARRIVAEYRYRDIAGDVIAIKSRWEPKGFTWTALRSDGTFKSNFPEGMSQSQLPLYRLPECVAMVRQGATLLVCEGEKDCETLHALGFAATTHAAGASGAGASYDATNYTPFFPASNTSIVVLPDNDAPGRAHAGKLAASLAHAGYTVRVCTLPDLKDKGDVTDYVTAAREADTPNDAIAADLHYHCTHAPLWTPDVTPGVALDPFTRELAEERAAILEHSAGYPRADAERIAWHDTRDQVATLRASLTPAQRLAAECTDPELAAIYRHMAELSRA